MAAAQTGTGKTAGFTLPLLERLCQQRPGGRRAARALVLVPTRELAAQVGESISTYGRYLPLRSTVIFGGVGIHPQRVALKRGVDIVVATPGRLLDHVSQRSIDLSQIDILVLDEADRMLDMGFIHDIKRVLALLPAKRQNLLFSATFADDIRSLANDLLDSPRVIEVAKRNSPAVTVNQRVLRVDRARKAELLAELVHRGGWTQVLVFTRTKHGANRLAQKLCRDNIHAAAIHGNKSQSARTRALAAFKSGTLRVLTATDIAARGLDIDQLPHVVNFELPFVAEDYVHRIGRTGRAGARGEAVSLVCVDENRLLRDIERLLGRSLKQEIVAGFTPDPGIAPQPILRNANAQSRRVTRDTETARVSHRNGRSNGSRRRGRRRGQSG